MIMTELVDNWVDYIKLVYRRQLWYGFDNIALRLDSKE